MWTACDLIITGHCLDHESSSEDLVCIRVRAGRYDDMYWIDEIKSLSFHIMFYRLFHGVAKYIVYGNTFSSFSLSDCDLYTPPPRDVTGDRTTSQDKTRSSLKRGTTSVAWSCIFKHCSFKTTDFKPLKHKQQSYMRALSLSVWEERAISFLLTLNN